MTIDTDTARETEVLQAEDARFSAMLQRDMTVLDASLSADLTYVHSTARFETKADHLANVRDGKPYYRGIAPRDRRVRVLSDTALVTGISEMRVERDGTEQRFTIRYLAVYREDGDRWRMTAWQSTKLPE
jgi:ketosteroid isomerase-like protein